MANLKAMFLGSWLGDKLMNEATIAETTDLGSFRRVRLSWRGGKGAPGDKMQFYIPEAGSRTYSPFAITSTSFELAMYVHGKGPGSAWTKALAAGQRVRFVGPQSSLDLAGITGPVALFGDETSFGVAKALFDLRNGDAMFRFEVGSRAECEPIIAALGLPLDSLVERTGQHLGAVARDVAGKALVLTGNAKAIQVLRGLVKGQPQRVKAYWAEGKRGLD